MKKLCILLDGNRFNNIETFYAEINRLFMQEEDWKLGNSLDAFDDMLYGSYGMLKDYDTLELTWRNFEKSNADLGVETTAQYYREKLKQPDVYNHEFFRQKLDELESGKGKTYIAILLEIINQHPNIQLIIE